MRAYDIELAFSLSMDSQPTHMGYVEEDSIWHQVDSLGGETFTKNLDSHRIYSLHLRIRQNRKEAVLTSVDAIQ